MPPATVCGGVGAAPLGNALATQMTAAMSPARSVRTIRPVLSIENAARRKLAADSEASHSDAAIPVKHEDGCLRVALNALVTRRRDSIAVHETQRPRCVEFDSMQCQHAQRIEEASLGVLGDIGG